MDDSMLMAIAGGFLLGVVIAWRLGRALVLKVAGPRARRLIVVWGVASGAFMAVMPAVLLAVLTGRDLSRTAREGAGGVSIASGDWGSLFTVGLGVAVLIAISLICGAVAGAICARLIANWRPTD